MTQDKTIELLVSMIKDLSEKSDINFENLRESNHKIIGNVQLLTHKDEAQTEKILEIKKELQELETDMNDIKPKIDSIYTVYTWTVRTLVTALVLSLLVAVGLKTK